MLSPWQTRTNCCRHKCFPVCPRAQHLLRKQILCPGRKKFSDFAQKHFVSAMNISQFARARKPHEQQCFLVCHRLYRSPLSEVSAGTKSDGSLYHRPLHRPEPALTTQRIHPTPPPPPSPPPQKKKKKKTLEPLRRTKLSKVRV